MLFPRAPAIEDSVFIVCLFLYQDIVLWKIWHVGMQWATFSLLNLAAFSISLTHVVERPCVLRAWAVTYNWVPTSKTSALEAVDRFSTPCCLARLHYPRCYLSSLYFYFHPSREPPSSLRPCAGPSIWCGTVVPTRPSDVYMFVYILLLFPFLIPPTAKIFYKRLLEDFYSSFIKLPPSYKLIRRTFSRAISFSLLFASIKWHKIIIIVLRINDDVINNWRLNYTSYDRTTNII